jgi:GNAT superfamily N-acetyltransferase
MWQPSKTQLLELIGDPGLAVADRRALVEHFPGHLRPLPESLDAMSRQHPPVTLWLEINGSDAEAFVTFSKEPYIRLGDIVITAELRGKWLGTAVMTELCKYADHHVLPIQGEVNPGPGSTDEAMGPLARWYFRHGFRQGDYAPALWVRNGTIRREPKGKGI